MKRILTIIILGLLIISISLFPNIIAKYNVEKLNSLPNITYKNLEDEVPIWDLGDKWVYIIDDLEYIDDSGNNKMIAYLTFNDLTLEVEEVTSTSYVLSFDLKVNGNFEIQLDDYSIKLTGRISRLFTTRINGDLIIKKSDLSIEEINFDLTGLLRIKITEQLFIPIPIPALYVPLKLKINFDFQDSFPIIDFPLNIEKNWTLPSIIFSIDGQIRSIWLNFFNFFIRIFRIFGIDIIPPEIARLLPRIDIGNLIIALNGDNIIHINSSIWQESPLIGIDTYDNITVPAGTFKAYDIILPIGLGNLYYSPEIGNIVKMTIEPINAVINMELKETNYI
jgi:hypothetical protein